MEMTVLAAQTEEYHQKIDDLERAILTQPQDIIDMPLLHHFADGVYIRQIFNPAGTLITTKIHKTNHAFAVMTGRVSVYIPGEGVQHIQAPYMGITKAGTRRVIYVHEDTIWVTFHANPDDGQDIQAIEDRIIERRELENGKTAFELAQEAFHSNLLGESE